MDEKVKMFQELDFAAMWAEYQVPILGFGLKVVGALVVLLIGLRIAGWLSGLVRKQSTKYASIDDTLGGFFASLVRWGVSAAVFIAALQVFGVQATSLVAILGALTLAIGLSLQGALGNIASGVMIMIFRPYKLGDYITTAGASGTVKDINLFQTVLATVDNVKVMVPNTQAIDGTITNFSSYPDRRVDLTFGIDYADDMDKAINLIKDVISADTRIRDYPDEPFVKVVNLGTSSVDIATRSWVSTNDYWDVRFDLIKKVKESFDKNGISFPFPHTTVEYKNKPN